MSSLLIPAFNGKFKCKRLPGEGSVLISDDEQLAILEGTVEQSVCDQIDGKRRVDDIVAALNGIVPPHDVSYAIHLMHARGILSEAHPSLPMSDAEFWNAVASNSLPNLMESNHVLVDIRHSPDICREQIEKSLSSVGIKSGSSNAVCVAFVSDYLDSFLEQLNREMFISGKGWLLVKPTGKTPLLGPLFIPGRTGCWECLAQRLRNARALEIYTKRKAVTDKNPRSESPAAASLPIPLTLVAIHLAKLMLCGDARSLEGNVLSLDLNTLQTNTHLVTRRPQCSVCGNPDLRRCMPTPPKLDNRDKLSTGGRKNHRTRSTKDTYHSLSRHVSPITGIVSDLVPQQHSCSEAIALYTAGHNFSLGGNSLINVRNGRQLRSAGKGANELQAQTSALCESLERYSATFQGDEYCVKGSLRSLGASAIHPNACMLFSDHQFANSDKWAALGSAFNVVPSHQLTDVEEIEWAPVWSMVSREFKYIPSAYLFYGYPAENEAAFCWANSNGTAAGSSYEEAVLEGFYEVTERDCVAMWWYNCLEMPKVDLSTFRDPYLADSIQYYRKNNRQVWALDLTNDFEVPTFAALSRRIDQPQEEIIFGFGSHLDADEAMNRAVAEMTQFLPAVSVPAQADGTKPYAYDDKHAIQWWKNATIANQPYLLPDGSATRTREDYLHYHSEDQLVDLMNCVLKTQSMNLDFLIYDYTQPDIDLWVCKVIVPGARHFWARYAPGRLYDVPVRLGMLGRPKSESELNPIPLFV